MDSHSPTVQVNYRFSGHETFPCRYAWLPKAAQALAEEANRDLLTKAREDEAMVLLGVGKNMVRSIRFWAECAGVITSTDKGYELTEFGREIFVGSRKQPALDPFLEDVQTLWLIHWKLATNQSALVFAWDFLLNQFQEPELYSGNVVRAFRKFVDQAGLRDVTDGSLEQLYHVFLRSYVPTRGDKGEVREDSLDCPLIELELLRQTGFTQAPGTTRRLEPKFAFRREDKPEISGPLFAYFVDQFWRNRGEAARNEQTLALSTLLNSRGSPGQVLKLNEADLRNRLLAIELHSENRYRFNESASVPNLVRLSNDGNQFPLSSVFQPLEEYA